MKTVLEVRNKQTIYFYLENEEFNTETKVCQNLDSFRQMRIL
jgi:hypothetical protein